MIGPAEIEEMMAERAEAREASRSEAQAGVAVLTLHTDPTPESAPPYKAIWFWPVRSDRKESAG